MNFPTRNKILPGFNLFRQLIQHLIPTLFVFAMMSIFPYTYADEIFITSDRVDFTIGPGNNVFYFDEDIIAFDTVTGNFSLHFDGSAEGLPLNADINAFHIDDVTGDILMSFTETVTVPDGVGAVDSTDIVRFSGGTFSLFLDGSTEGLDDTDCENINGIAFDQSGNLVISTVGAFVADGVFGRANDLFVLDGGVWSKYLDGSAVGFTAIGDLDCDGDADNDDLDFITNCFGQMPAPVTDPCFPADVNDDGSVDILDHSLTANNLNTDENISGIWIDPVLGDVALTTKGPSPTTGGANNDIFLCVPPGAPPIASCNILMALFTGAVSGFPTPIEGIHVIPNFPPEITTTGPPSNVSVLEEQVNVKDFESTDDQDAEGAGLTYSIAGGPDAAFFLIDPTFGLLDFLIGPWVPKFGPDFENPMDANGDNVYTVVIQVTDSGGLSDFETVHVILLNSCIDVEGCNLAPVILGGEPSIVETVPENQTDAADVETADDFDAEGAGLIYSLVGGPDVALFSINLNTGVITFNSPPDFDNPGDADGNNVYLIVVEVVDSGGLSDAKNVYIVVEKANTAPVIQGGRSADDAFNT